MHGPPMSFCCVFNEGNVVLLVLIRIIFSGSEHFTLNLQLNHYGQYYNQSSHLLKKKKKTLSCTLVAPALDSMNALTLTVMHASWVPGISSITFFIKLQLVSTVLLKSSSMALVVVVIGAGRAILGKAHKTSWTAGENHGTVNYNVTCEGRPSIPVGLSNARHIEVLFKALD